MTIDPKDFKTLLVRLTLVTLAVRLVPALTLDLSPGEAALALGLGRGGATSEPLAQWHHSWAAATGGLAIAARALGLLAEAVLPALAVAFARAAGQGSIAGLTTGLLLALGPLGMAVGARSDSGASAALGALAALFLLREGLRAASQPYLLASAATVLLLGVWAPAALVVVPAGLYAASRAVAMAEVRRTALLGWPLAALAALGIRALAPGFLLTEPHAAAEWLTQAANTASPSLWLDATPLEAGLAALAAVVPVGPTGVLAAQLDVAAAPLWAWIGGGVLMLASLVGAVRGLVQADPPRPAAGGASTGGFGAGGLGGAAAADGWRTLGVGTATTPRTLGDRDWGPGLLLLLGAAGFVLVQQLRGAIDGVPDALQAGRVGAALLFGPGLAALGAPRAAQGDAADPRFQRRFYWTLGAVALGVFALGAWQLLLQTSDPSRTLAKNAARQVHALVGRDGAALALGRRGLPIAAMLDAGAVTGRIDASQLSGPQPLAALVRLLAAKPPVLVLTGDADALGLAEPGAALTRPDLVAVRQLLEPTLQASGYELDDNAAFVRAGLGVLTYTRGGSGDPRAIRPQLGPNEPPQP